MLFGAGFALVQEIDRCKLAHPGMSDKQAFELSVRPQGCVRRHR